MLAAVEGMVLESDEVTLGDGLALVRAETLRDVPDELREDEMGTVAVLALDAAPGDGRALEDAGRRLRRLQTALRLWDDAEPSLGPTAWARTDGGAWSAVPLATGVRRDAGDCLLAAEEEDPLRAFCSLVSRRTPRAGELAWALRRFELGCERAFAVEALTDWLLAGRALLADPDAPGLRRHGGAPGRRSARRPRTAPALERRLDEAIRLERAAITGHVRPEPAVEDLIADLGGNLRAVLRDVLCGHLDPQLRRVADEMLGRRRAEISLGEQVLAHEREALDVVDVAVELGDDDRRRVAERGRAGARGWRLARGQRRELVRRGRRRGARGPRPSSGGSSPSPTGGGAARLTTRPPNGMSASRSLRWKKIASSTGSWRGAVTIRNVVAGIRRAAGRRGGRAR